LGFERRSLSDALNEIGCDVRVGGDGAYRVEVNEKGRVVCRLPSSFDEPSVEMLGKEYRLIFGYARESDLPVIIRNRPREVVFNLNHSALKQKGPGAVARALGLEITYLNSADGEIDGFFESVLDLLAAI
jgi:hypothetical protein